MRKSALYVFALCVFHLSTNAQFGFKLGTTVSSFYYSDTKPNPNIGYDIDLRPYLGYDIEWVQLGNQKPVMYPYLGSFYNFQFSNWFSLQPELSFTQKGVSFSQNEYEQITYKVKISYLEMPLSMAFKFINKEKFFSAFILGGYGAYKLSGIKIVASHNSGKEKTKIDCIENFEAGYHLGLNFKQVIFDQDILFEIRFFQGLTDLFYMPADQPKLYYETQKTKSTGFHISLGYAF